MVDQGATRPRVPAPAGRTWGRRLARVTSAAERALVRGLRSLGPHRWGVAAVTGTLVAYLGLYLATPRAHAPGADGHYSWLFARSLAFDGDVHFANDYELCGDPWQDGRQRGTGRPDNPFYMGPSLFWTPVLWVAKHLVTIPAAAPANERFGCRGRFTALTLALGPLLGAATIALSYRAARRFASDGEAATAASILAVGGAIPAYAAIMPSYSHVYAAFAVSLLLWTALRAGERPERWGRWVAAAAAAGLCSLQRQNYASLAIIPAALAAQTLWGRWGALAARWAVLAAGALAGTIPAFLLYHYLYGKLFVMPQGHYYVRWGHGHPLLLLFSPNGGLLFTTPAMWLPILGLAPGLRRQPWLFGALLFVAVVETYVSSCPLDWFGGATYGARRLVPLTPIFILLTALLVARVHAWFVAHPRWTIPALVVTFLAPLTFASLGAVSALARRRVPLQGASQEDTYGAGVAWAWATIDHSIGDLAVLPAEQLFSWRYGLPRQSFRRATAAIFIRNNKTMAIRDDTITIDASAAPLLRGFAPSGDEMALVGPPGALVFTAHWPYATRLTVAARAPGPPRRLRVGMGRLRGVTWLGEVPLSATVPEAWPAVRLPPGVFDSGLNELVFDCQPRPCTDVVLQAVQLHDDTVYPPPFQ